jgi:eukaryotic-like serine/threonine-protein kinase
MGDNTMSATTLELQDDGGFYVAIGEIVAGKYRVESVLGSGGMAFVLSARHVELDQHFALKFLDERFLGNAKITERFTQEAKAACKIRSEHVARVYDVGIHNGAPFFVMEHLEGRDLCALVLESGPLRVDDAVEYVMQACEALAVAHCHGIVHRDIKPENLFLVEREGLPIIKVLDFGISKVALAGGEPASRLTGELTLGTPCYMSPEQIRSTASADARSDQWSLGVVLYELLAGTEAFRAESVNAVCAAVLEREPEPLQEIRSDLPDGLAEVVMKCLEKDPEHRFTDVAELATALLPFAPTRALVSAERSSSVMKGARRAGNSEQHISAVRPTSLASSSRHPSIDRETLVPRRRSRAPVAAAFGVAAVAGLLAYGFLWKGELGVLRSFAGATHGQSPPPPPPVAAPEPEPATAPTAIRTPPAAEEKQPESAAAPAVTARRPAPAVRQLPSAHASAPAQQPTPSSVAPPSPSVELGY